MKAYETPTMSVTSVCEQDILTVSVASFIDWDDPDSIDWSQI